MRSFKKHIFLFSFLFTAGLNASDQIYRKDSTELDMCKLAANKAFGNSMQEWGDSRVKIQSDLNTFSYQRRHHLFKQGNYRKKSDFYSFYSYATGAVCSIFCLVKLKKKEMNPLYFFGPGSAVYLWLKGKHFTTKMDNQYQKAIYCEGKIKEAFSDYIDLKKNFYNTSDPFIDKHFDMLSEEIEFPPLLSNAIRFPALYSKEPLLLEQQLNQLSLYIDEVVSKLKHLQLCNEEIDIKYDGEDCSKIYKKEILESLAKSLEKKIVGTVLDEDAHIHKLIDRLRTDSKTLTDERMVTIISGHQYEYNLINDFLWDIVYPPQGTIGHDALLYYVLEYKKKERDILKKEKKSIQEQQKNMNEKFRQLLLKKEQQKTEYQEEGKFYGMMGIGFILVPELSLLLPSMMIGSALLNFMEAANNDVEVRHLTIEHKRTESQYESLRLIWKDNHF